MALCGSDRQMLKVKQKDISTVVKFCLIKVLIHIYKLCCCWLSSWQSLNIEVVGFTISYMHHKTFDYWTIGSG